MINKLLTFCFYLLFLITPLLFTSATSELFEYNKMMFVYSLTAITTGLWVLKMISQKELIFKRTPLDIPLALFLLSQILSTIFSIDPHTSIWGYYSRSNGGLLSVISYILLYYVFVSNFNKETVIKLLKTAIFGGVAASIYAIPEHFGISPSCIILTNEFTASCWVQDVQARVFGTIGQPNWLAALLAMLIFPALYFLLTAQSFKSKSIYLISLIAMYLAFTFTYSRGATLGLIGGFGVFGLSLFIKYFYTKKIVEIKLLAIVAISFVLINLFFGSAITRFKLFAEPAIPSRPEIAQSSGTQLENGGTESGQIRLIVWEGALEIFKAYPILGSGVETFAYSYYQFRPNAHNMVSEWDFLYNKAHNEYLNYLATTGIVGFVSYLSVILTFIIFCIRSYIISFRNKPSHNTYPSLLIPTLLAGYTTYLIQNFFLFSVVNVSVLFYLFPAFIFVYLDDAKSLSESNMIQKTLRKLFQVINKKGLSKTIVQGLVTLITIVVLISIFNLWEADTLYKKGSDYNDLNNPGRAYSYLIQAVKLNPSEPLYLSELGNAAASSSIALAQEDSTTSAELKDDAQFFTDLALSISPVNTTINRTAIRTYFSLALVDPALEEKTIGVVDKSIALSPTDPKLLHNKGIILSQFNRIKEATASIQEAIKLKPNYRDARLSLADLYIKNNQPDLAETELNAVLKQIPGDPDALKFLEQIK